MARARNQLQRRRQAAARLERLMQHPNHLLLIHYSCQSFYDRTDGSSPRITSIAVRHYGSGQTTSFSIHMLAERRGIPLADIPIRYDELERTMLEEYFQFVQLHVAFEWLHWNMRDVNYGFAALEHRYRVLGGGPSAVPEDRRTDLAALLIDMYGPGYAGHPRLTSLMKLNRISTLSYMSGQAEADAFEAKEYVKLHQSTLRKVDVIANILGRVWDGTLKTNSSQLEQYGSTMGGIVEVVTDHWVYKVAGFVGIVASVASLVI